LERANDQFARHRQSLPHPIGKYCRFSDRFTAEAAPRRQALPLAGQRSDPAADIVFGATSRAVALAAKVVPR
jgi:hypothetical protein